MLLELYRLSTSHQDIAATIQKSAIYNTRQHSHKNIWMHTLTRVKAFSNPLSALQHTFGMAKCLEDSGLADAQQLILHGLCSSAN